MAPDVSSLSDIAQDQLNCRVRRFRGVVAPCAMLVLGLVGCEVGPDYKAPQVAVAPTFVNQNMGDTQDPAALAKWWTIFDDALLTELVEQSIAHNHDVRIAQANLQQARELLIEARLDQYPVVPARAGYDRQHLSRISAPSSGRDRDLFFGGFDATWEFDMFGRVRRSLQASQANVEAFEANRRDVLVSVISEVARNYFELRGNQQRLRVAQQNAENQKRTYNLTVTLLEGGRGTDLDTSRALSQWESTLAIMPPLESAVERVMYRLAVLTGQSPEKLLSRLNTTSELPEPPRTLSIGTPEMLLRRRPDVQAAERSLAAATARIGVNTADLYPRLTLVGSVGVEVTRFGDIAQRGAEYMTLGPRLSWAAFDLERVRARIRASQSQADAELANFERTVLLALEEVDASLVTYGKELRRLEHLRAAEQASRRATTLARQRFEDGITDFLTVLDAERRTLEAQDQLAESRTRVSTQLIAVYKALGGGWESAPEPAPTTAPASTAAATKAE